MSDIPIFDSLTHPCPNGNWSGKAAVPNTFPALLNSMEDSNIGRALCIAQRKVDSSTGYTEYSQLVHSMSDKLCPVAIANYEEIADDAHGYVQDVKENGYVAIKIHPRISNADFSDPRCISLIHAASQAGLPLMICTYLWSKSQELADLSTRQLLRILRMFPDGRFVLMHGGVVHLMEYVEIVRNFPNTLLDLSFTLCKYEGSSLDLDLAWLFRNFDRRIAIGSDGPEFSQKKLRQRYNQFITGISEEKAVNIAYRNLTQFMGL